MRPIVIIRPAADADLDDQAVYLSRVAGTEVALRFYDAADRTFQFLGRNPGLGQQRRSSRLDLADVRVWRVEGFEDHLVFYRTIEGGVEIVRVLHGRRDLDAILGPER